MYTLSGVKQGCAFRPLLLSLSVLEFEHLIIEDVLLVRISGVFCVYYKLMMYICLMVRLLGYRRSDVLKI